MARITSPFGAFTAAREVASGRDLQGLTALVTGAASGIGLETARALAEAGADVIIAGRRPDLAAAAVEAVNRSAGAERARSEVLDLSDFASVRALAGRLVDRPLHLLINNAGVMACPYERTRNDLEMQIGTNHFGHFLLAVLLAPALEAGARQKGQARVVSLSSIGHIRSPVRFEDPHYRVRPYDKWEAYGQSKTANALFAVGFHARFKDRGIAANAVMPGGIMTPLQRHLPREEMIAFGWIDEGGRVAEGFKTPEQGASTSVWAAIGPELDGVGGLYLENCAEAELYDPSKGRFGYKPYARDPDLADRLWELSEETVES